MNGAEQHTAPAPRLQQFALPPQLIFFAVFGGPVAWFLQLNVCFALASNPCFIDNQRIVAHVSSHSAASRMVVIAVAACALSLAAMLSALRAYRHSRRDRSESDSVIIDAGRTCFLALWGICFGAGSALMALLTALALMVLPRCVA